MIQRIQRVGTAAALTLAAALFATTAFAQAQPTPQQPATNPPPASAAAQPGTGPAPTSAELQQFANAASSVLDIRKATEPKLAAAKDANARTQLQQSAEKQMEAAVQQHLTVQRYEQIAMVVQTDDSVRAKVIQLMQKPAKS
jgi:hypothetical protein